MSIPLALISLEQFEKLSRLAMDVSQPGKAALSAEFRALAKAVNSSAVVGSTRDVVPASTEAVFARCNYESVEAILRFPAEMHHPLERVAASLNLLRRSEDYREVDASCPRASRIPLDQVQAELSRLLIEHPVLMDPRMVFRVEAPMPDWSPVAHALAETSFASLPRLNHGITEEQLRAFAAHSCVEAGLTALAPNCNSPASSVRGQTAMDVAVSDHAAPGCAGATRGSFIESVLVLSELAEQESSRRYLRTSSDSSGMLAADKIYQALALVFWDTVTMEGVLSRLSRLEVVRMLQMPAFYKTEDELSQHPTIANSGRRAGSPLGSLVYQVEQDVDMGLFNCARSFGATTREASPIAGTVVDKRTRECIKLLTDIGTFATEKEAAQFLSRVTVGVGRPWRTHPAPNCSHDAALSFIDVLADYGVGIALPPPADAGLLPPGNVAQVARDTWSTALEVHTARASMEAVLSRVSAPAPDAPRTRRRVL